MFYSITSSVSRSYLTAFDANMAIREVLGDAAFPGLTYPLAVAEARKAAAS